MGNLKLILYAPSLCVDSFRMTTDAPSQLVTYGAVASGINSGNAGIKSPPWGPLHCVHIQPPGGYSDSGWGKERTSFFFENNIAL